MNGIVLRGGDGEIESRAKRHGLKVTISDGWGIAYERTLIVSPGVRVPWDMIDAGFHFLERWDAAAALWRYGELAADVGGPADRERTREIVRDLRVPLYAPELLFVRQSEDGQRLMEAWQEEGGDMRLGFLRALYRVKPLFCALPRGWMELARVDVSRRLDRHAAPRTGITLVKVEVMPGRYVRCRPGDEEKTRARFRDQQLPRRQRNAERGR